MNEFRAGVALIFILMALFVVVMNWSYTIGSWRNRRRGIDTYYSTVPIVSLFLAYVAHSFYPFTPKAWIGLIPLADIGNWVLLWLPVALIRRP